MILGGIRSIGRFTSLLVPFMIVGYVASSLVVLALNASEIPHALWLIFYHAFTPAAATGGFAGAAVAAAMRFGIARGVFSNESGLGSAPIAAAAARTNDPVKQALVSMTQTFIDTLVVCTMTALVILTATPWTQGVGAGQLTSASFGADPGPRRGDHCRRGHGAVCLLHPDRLELLRRKGHRIPGRRRAIRIYRVVFVAVVIVGAMMKLEFVWNFSDLMNGMMAIPNLIALLMLSKVVKPETDRYFKG